MNIDLMMFEADKVKIFVSELLKQVILIEFLTLKPHLIERTGTESKIHHIKEAITKYEG